MAKRTASNLIEHLNGWIKYQQPTIDKFKANLDVNPAYAFEWADQATTAAAKIEIAHRVIAVLEHEKGGFEEAGREISRQMVHGARHPKRSTSALTNHMEQERLAAYAEIFADFYEER